MECEGLLSDCRDAFAFRSGISVSAGTHAGLAARADGIANSLAPGIREGCRSFLLAAGNLPAIVRGRGICRH